MANIMDGSTGTAHISSKDWATFNEATYGMKNGVFAWGDRFKLTMSTANKGMISSGAALVAGRRVWVEAPESVTLDNGTQGMKRHDVVGIQYETYVSGHATREKATVKVVKGTPQSGSAADPALPENFLPMWRVPLDGLNVGDPVSIAPRIPSLRGDAKNVDGVRFARCGNVVTCVLHNKSVTVYGSWGEAKICDIPKGFAPPEEVIQPVHIQNNDYTYSAAMRATADGRIMVGNLGGTGFNGAGLMSCTASWCVEV